MRLPLLLPLLLLSACATPSTAYTVAPPDVVEREARMQEYMMHTGQRDRAEPSLSSRLPAIQRLTAVAERVLISAAPYCGNRLMPAYPVSAGTPDNGPPVVINAADPLLPGDRIVALDGQPVPYGKQGFVWLARNGGGKAHSGQPITLTVRRGTQTLNSTYATVPACNYDVVLEDNGQWNAYADGRKLHVELRLMQDLRNDDDLAFVLAHELSHNILGHVGKQQQNAMAGAAAGLAIEAILSGFGGGQMNGDMVRTGAGIAGMGYSQDFEREADYVGLYILANTGYDLYAGPRVARAIARQDARSIRNSSSHPTSSDRAASLITTIGEIESKARSGQPLVPNAPVRQ